MVRYSGVATKLYLHAFSSLYMIRIVKQIANALAVVSLHAFVGLLEDLWES
jgi:hypothetical protein